MRRVAYNLKTRTKKLAYFLALFCSLSRCFVVDTFSAFGQAPPNSDTGHSKPQSSSQCGNLGVKLEVRFLNVGQGMAVLITCPDGQTQVLVDAADSDVNYPGAETLFSQGLLQGMRGDSNLELAISTHPHPDHVYGFLSLLAGERHGGVQVRAYYDNGANNPDSLVEEEIRRQIQARGRSYQVIPPGLHVRNDICSIPFVLMSPRGKVADTLACPQNLNDCSVVMKFSFGQVSFLLAADTTTNWEREALMDQELKGALSAQVLLVGHHGAGAAGLEFLERVNPDFLILSSGDPNIGKTKSVGYPETEVVDRLNAHCIRKHGEVYHRHLLKTATRKGALLRWEERKIHQRVLATEMYGTLSFYTDGRQLCWESEHFRE